MKKQIVLIILMLAAVSLQAQSPEKLLRRGNRQYRKGNYAEAEAQYRKLLADTVYDKDEFDIRVDAQFNLGDALYKQEKYDEAFKAFHAVTEQTNDSKLKSKAYFNMGNCLLTQNRYYDAFCIFKKALRINPDNEDALYNLEFCRAHLVKSQIWVDPEIPHGQVWASEKEAFNGQVVFLQNEPEKGYQLKEYQICQMGDTSVHIQPQSDTLLKMDYFVMPPFDVEVSAAFEKPDKNNQSQQQQQQQQQQQDQQDQQQQDQQQDQKDQQDQQQNQQNQQEQENQQQDQQQDQQGQEDQQQKQQQRPNPQDMSREDAQRMLEALEGQEKQTLEKVNAEKLGQQKKKKTDKDW